MVFWSRPTFVFCPPDPDCSPLLFEFEVCSAVVEPLPWLPFPPPPLPEVEPDISKRTADPSSTAQVPTLMPRDGPDVPTCCWSLVGPHRVAAPDGTVGEVIVSAQSTTERAHGAIEKWGLVMASRPIFCK